MTQSENVLVAPRNPKNTTYGAIVERNNAIFGRSQGQVLEWGNPVSSAIHRISLQTAEDISTHLKRGAIQKGLPLTYTLACIAQESLFDPECFNKNLSGSNRENNPAKYDIGLCQLNLRYLIDPKVPERATLELAQSFAHNLDLAVPYFLENQKGLLDYARTLSWSRGADPRSKNPLWVASTMFNQGRVGGVRNIEARDAGIHGASIAKLEVWFADQLGYASVMSDVL